MGIPQIPTIVSEVGDSLTPDIDTTYVQDQYITYEASGGLLINDDGQLEKVSRTQFAARMKIDRTTLYDWRERIPDFWDRVEIRRREIFSKERMALVWNGVFMRAAKGDAKQAEMVLSHYADYVPPAQRIKVEAGDSMFDLMNAARNRVIEVEETVSTPNIVEAEVVDKPVETVDKPTPSPQPPVAPNPAITVSPVVKPSSVQSNILTFDPLSPTATHDEEFI